MKLVDAYSFLRDNKNTPLGKLIGEYQAKYPHYTGELKINKGAVGQFLEKLIGLENNSSHLDFLDGELKTNKADANGTPMETMFISQISANFDQLIDTQMEFEDSWLYSKIRNLLYVPVCKVGTNPESWYFHSAYHIQLDNNQELFEQLQDDFLCIRAKLRDNILNSPDGFIHTSNGKYIQIRSKDAKRKNGLYNPIYSKIHGRYVSNKNHAFYFKRDFMRDIQSGTISAEWSI
ncbi:MAG: MutH/Sau3AI family endonuclease [Alcaligenaceae bacterium]|nr:MutH/Sau3AI family endonuclease [Alcaligenaceae bacterium]